MEWVNVWLMTLSLWSPAGTSGAQAAAPPPPPSFEGSAEFSYVGTSGNSDTRSLGAGTTLIFRPKAWTVTSKAALIHAEDRRVTRARSLLFSTQAARSLTERLSVFAGHEFLRDRFAGIRHRNTVDAGLGYAAIKNARHELALRIGTGYASEHRLAAPNRSSGIATAAAAYRLKLSESAAFEDEIQAVTALDGGRDQRVNHTASLTAKLTTLFSLKVKHATRWVRSPVPGFRKTDAAMGVALVAKF